MQASTRRTNGGGVFGQNYGASINEITDGTSNTIMLSELMGGHQMTIRGVQALLYGPFFMADHCPNDRTPDILDYCDPDDQGSGAPAPCILGSGGVTAVWISFIQISRSAHPGGVVSTLCDGSTRFVNDTVDLQTWQHLATPAGGEVISGDF